MEAEMTPCELKLLELELEKTLQKLLDDPFGILIKLARHERLGRAICALLIEPAVVPEHKE
jgi:hypothetical protein